QAFATLDTWAWFEHLIATRWPDAFQGADAFDSLGRPCSPLTFMLLVALTQDGSWLQFAAVAPRLFAAKMKALGLDWMFTDDEWKGLPLYDDPDKRMALWTTMLESANRKTLAEWRKIFGSDADVFAEQFRSGVSILEHPQLLHDGSVVVLEDIERGAVRQPGTLIRASATPAQPLRSAPTLDQHRDEIIAEALRPVEPTARATDVP